MASLLNLGLARLLREQHVARFINALATKAFVAKVSTQCFPPRRTSRGWTHFVPLGLSSGQRQGFRPGGSAEAETLSESDVSRWSRSPEGEHCTKLVQCSG